MLYLVPCAHMAKCNALHAGQTSQDAICSLQPTKMSGIFKGYLRDSQRRLDEFSFQIQLEIWWPCCSQLPSSVRKKQEGTLRTSLITESPSSGGGKKTPLVLEWSACSKAVGNWGINGICCILPWWLKGNSSTLMARLTESLLVLFVLLQYMVWLEKEGVGLQHTVKTLP